MHWTLQGEGDMTMKGLRGAVQCDVLCDMMQVLDLLGLDKVARLIFRETRGNLLQLSENKRDTHQLMRHVRL